MNNKKGISLPAIILIILALLVLSWTVYYLQISIHVVSPEIPQQENQCQNKRIGVVYAYESDKTYNFDWRQQVEPLFPKVRDSLLEISGCKLNYSFDILGSIQTNQFCWNPAEVGVSYNESITKIDRHTNQIISKEFLITTTPLPGSDFDDAIVIHSTERIIDENGKSYLEIINLEKIELNCPHCKIYSEDRTKEFQELFPDENYIKVNTTYIAPDCNDALLITHPYESYANRLNNLKSDAAQLLNFNKNDYDELMIIFGKLGTILPSESEINFKFRCTHAIGFIGGWGDLTFAENFLLKGDFIECPSKGYGGFVFYEIPGWHAIVHEFLHRVGAVDIYDTGTMLGYESPAYRRAKALEIDPLADESIMGNEDRACKKLAEITKKDECSKTELERVYLDKYNKEIIGA
jgi:hypothetical protein